jgi:flavin reductase (DIM6/NTAB) family NADH-FMN oxidoreductase RutF
MKKLLRTILFGPIPVIEYATVTVTNDIKERVWLVEKKSRIDISSNHWLLCLDPVVFGVWFKKGDNSISFENRKQYEICFTDAAIDGKVVAVLKLAFFDTIVEEEGVLLLLKITKATTKHINVIKTRLIFQKYYKKPEQDFVRLKSYAAAYSYPRKVRIVSFKEDEQFNIFPMDLTGDIPLTKRYVFGLRHTNQTLGRIIATEKIAISEVPHTYKETIYQLGKHHRGPVSADKLSFGLIQSESFGFPIPAWANSYKEIRIIKTMNLGSHMLLWGEAINEKVLTQAAGHLFHIHFLYYLHQQRKGLAYPSV